MTNTTALVPCLLLLALILLLVTGASAGRWVSVPVGDLVLGFGPERGLTVDWCGQRVVEGSSVVFHDDAWKQVYLSLPGNVTDVEVSDIAGGGKQLRILSAPKDALFEYDYIITGRPNGTVEMAFSCTKLKDIPLGVETCFVQLPEAPIVGQAYEVTGESESRKGFVALEATSKEIDATTLLAHQASRVVIHSRVGALEFATEGGSWFSLIDGRLRFGGTPVSGWYWGGMLGATPELGKTASYGFTLKCLGRPPVAGPSLAGSAPSLVQVASATGEAQVSERPVLIPAPKQLRWGQGAFELTSKTPIIVRDKPAPEDLRAVRDLNNELQKRFGFRLPVLEAHEVLSPVGAIVLGEVEYNKHLAGTSSTGKSEGYFLRVSPSGVLLAGQDQKGTYWGVQSLLQLLHQGEAGPELPSVRITDWPDFMIRGAHLCLGDPDLSATKLLIGEVLRRYKLNTVVLEIESIKWESHPEINPNGPTPEQLGELADFCREHFMEPIPQIQSGGHCEYWLFRDGQHKDLAEDPANPYNYCPSNPAVYDLLYDLFEETEKWIKPKYFHMGHDEMWGVYAECPRCQGKSAGELFAEDVTRIYDWWAARGVESTLWGDMALAPIDEPGGNDAYNGGGEKQFATCLPLLPKDLIISDWHYGGNYERFPSLPLWKEQGKRVIAGPWFDLGNIWNFSRDAARFDNVMGMIGTTWCGVGSLEAAFDFNINYLASLVYTADCAWSVGQRAPDKLPYSVEDRYLAPLQLERAEPSAGFLVDLSGLANRSLVDADGSGWMGFGAGRDLSALPQGEVLLGKTRFLIGQKAIVLAGTLAPASLPSAVEGIQLGQRATSLSLLVTSGFTVPSGAQVATLRVHYADGEILEAPLQYNKQLRAFYHSRPTLSSPQAWQGQTPGGQPLGLSSWNWVNPRPEEPIASVDFVSTGTGACPALVALTGLTD